jgi:hypothetical protein
MTKQRRTIATIPLLLLIRRLLEAHTADMEPLPRTPWVIARDHLPIAAPITITIFDLVRVVGVSEWTAVIVVRLLG